MKILIEGPILTQSGYGEHARFVFESLRKHADLYVKPLSWGHTTWRISDASKEVIDGINRQEEYSVESKNKGVAPQYDLQVHVGIANEFTKKAPKSVLITAGIETDRVSPKWLQKILEGIDKIIVPSNHAKEGFTSTSYEVLTNSQSPTLLECTCPVRVVPYPVKQFKDQAEDDESKVSKISTNFNFLTVALLGPRKNIEKQIEWFLKEFKNEPDVGLVLKTGFAKSSTIDRAKTEKHLRTLVSKFKDSKCKVYLMHGSMSELEINSLYSHSKIKAYLSFSHGEGYGLPIFEAAYNGLPVVATDWSGHLDFLTMPVKQSGRVKEKKMFAKVDYKLKEIPKEVAWKDIIPEGSSWAFPTENSARRQMRNVYKNYGMYAKWASTLKGHVLENYEHLKIKEMMAAEIIDTHTTQPAKKETKPKALVF